MMPQQLVEIALHVLVAWTGGEKPDPEEVEILRKAFPSSAQLPVDELACQVVHDLSGRVFAELDRERKQPGNPHWPKKWAG